MCVCVWLFAMRASTGHEVAGATSMQTPQLGQAEELRDDGMSSLTSSTEAARATSRKLKGHKQRRSRVQGSGWADRQ